MALTGLALGFVTAWLLVRLLIGVARRRGILAEPNHRSSHTTPTPTLGGIGFVVPVLVWAGVASLAGGWGAAASVAPALLAGGALVAAVGLWDDLRPSPAWLRLVIHALAVALALVVLDSIGHGIFRDAGPAWLVVPVALLALVWLLNLYNFMDGIDGLTAAQTLLFCGGALLLGDLTVEMQQGLAVLAGAVGGFYAFNRAPARIFMGDVGSGFLGFVVGIVALALALQGRLPLAVSLVLLSAFIVDASYTLAVRLITRQRVSEAHRSHCYQKAARRLGHAPVTLALLGYGIVWLLPLAWLAAFDSPWRWPCVAAAGLPILIACLYYGAGLPDEEAAASGVVS